jgi:hypothetical protein
VGGERIMATRLVVAFGRDFVEEDERMGEELSPCFSPHFVLISFFLRLEMGRQGWDRFILFALLEPFYD